MYTETDAQRLLEKVKSLGGATPNARVRMAVDRLLDVLFPLILELRLTEDEWAGLIAHLNRTGAEGQFAVSAWLLGLSQLVQDMNSPLRETATEQTILGPFYKEGAPLLENDAPFYRKLDEGDEYLLMEGRVLDEQGTPIAGVEIDAWGANSLGRYSGWDEDQPDYNLRGRLITDEKGRYAIRTVFPRPYAIPDLLAPGAMLEALGRQAWRPPHLHFQLRKAGHVPLVTQVYLAGHEYLEIDSAVAVKDSLIAKCERHSSPAALEARNCDRPFHSVHFDFCIQPEERNAA